MKASTVLIGLLGSIYSCDPNIESCRLINNTLFNTATSSSSVTGTSSQSQTGSCSPSESLTKFESKTSSYSSQFYSITQYVNPSFTVSLSHTPNVNNKILDNNYNSIYILIIIYFGIICLISGALVFKYCKNKLLKN